MSTDTRIFHSSNPIEFERGDIVFLTSYPTTIVMVTGEDGGSTSFAGTVIAVDEGSIYSLGDTCQSFNCDSFTKFVGSIEIDSR